MAYLGNTPTTQSFISGTDYFNGTGSQTAFTLSRTVASVNDIQAVVNNVVQQPNDAYTISGTTITFTSAPSSGTNNVYVRYLSTTTQSITPSQNTVSYSTLNSDNQSKLGISFKNRIINGAMVISQRYGTSAVSDAANIYVLDRWTSIASVSNKFSVGQYTNAPTGFVNSLGVSSNSSYTVLTGQAFVLQQAIEGYNVADLNWGTANAKTVTLSFQVYSSLTGTFGGVITNSAQNRSFPFTYTIASANTWTPATVTITGDTSGTWLTTNGIGLSVFFGLGVGASLSGTAGAWAGATYYSATGATSVVGTNGATFYITGVQLEVGSTATSFDYRPYGTELALCQRYYVQFLGSNAYEQLCIGMSSTNQNGYCVVPLPVTMRSTPTLTYSTVSTTLRWTQLDNSFNGTAIAIDQSSTKTPQIYLTVASGMTSYRTGFITANNSTSAYVGFSSEL